MNATNPPLPEIPHLEIDNGEPMVDSREVAKRLDRNHFHVIDAIRNLDLSNDFKDFDFQNIDQ